MALPLRLTLPTLLLIEADAALFDVHERVVLDPAVTVVGAAVKVTVGVEGLMMLPAEVPHPLNQAVTKLKIRAGKNRREVAHQSLFIAVHWVHKPGTELPTTSLAFL